MFVWVIYKHLDVLLYFQNNKSLKIAILFIHRVPKHEKKVTADIQVPKSEHQPKFYIQVYKQCIMKSMTSSHCHPPHVPLRSYQNCPP